jgi:hypothetical protein
MNAKPQPVPDHGPKYFVNIEGTDYPWPEETISVAQIRDLSTWEPAQQIVEVNLDDNSETTLGDDAVVTLKPGHGFAKKVRFQRG